ncbi:MAG: ABC transporter ATP-binding protein [Planctomyces sp.]|nr:ABC transporter ATP-binding protein [Planctomyces sp.]
MSLELKQIVKTYADPEGGLQTILNVPEFSLGQGEQVALVGTSGSGKTTLLNVAAGITLPDSGTVMVGGIEITKMLEAVRDRFRSERIGYVFQTFNLLPAFTALENVLLGMSFSSQPANKHLAIELLGRVGLGDRLHYRPGQLSVGQQQRVSVARALAKTPRLLLADEPTANVDGPNQAAVLRLMQESCRENNVTLLLVTHTAEVAKQFTRVERLSDFNLAAPQVASSHTTGAMV